METRTIYLIRHGKIRLEDDQRCYVGQLDLPLDEEGIRQARYLQQEMACLDIGAIYCSDLSRSRQTADLIAVHRDLPVIARKDLREINLGAWEGCAFADIARRFPNEFRDRGADIGYYRTPGGESFADCGKRVTAAFFEILNQEPGNILVVGHAGVNRLLLCNLLGMPIANLFRIQQDYGCLNMIRRGNFGYQVKLINYRPARRRPN